MSALGDVAAAFLPPEAGGPDPERVATVARQMLGRMPKANQAAIAAALVGLEGAALARHRRTLGRLSPSDRAALLTRAGALGEAGAGAIDALKALVLLAAGADTYADAIYATGTKHTPSRPDPDLALADAGDLPALTQAEAVVIGSGAGGAFAARELARAGVETLILEEGEYWDSARLRAAHPLVRFASIYRDGGSTVAFGRPAVTLPIGRAVGGTTLINSGTCFRPPPTVVGEWRDRHGLALAGGDLDERLHDVEETINVGPVPLEIMGRNGRLSLAGAERLGLEAGPLRRNALGCRASCQCAIGCPNNAKSGVHLTTLPQACEAGARIVTGARVERILHADGVVSGVLVRTGEGRRIEVRSCKVVVAAGATETPPLLRRSGLAGHERIGRGMSVHPALGVAGRFEEPVVAWEGVMQSAGVEAFHEREGILLEATSTPPGLGSMTLPGAGPALLGEIERADHLATLGVMIADGPSGAVRGARRPLISYRLAREDAARLISGLTHAARVLLAAGATEVIVGDGVPPLRSAEEAREVAAGLDVRKLHVAAFHPTGTVAAGSDPARHPCGPDGALRGVEGLWIGDASIIPSCPTVNPQVSIMALAAGVGRAAAAA